MVFSTIIFLFRFLPITLALYYLAPAKLKNTVLFVCSLVFYCWGEVRFFPVMLALILINYLCGLGLEAFDAKPGVRKVLLLVALAASLGMLFYFKYANFVLRSINSLLGTGFAAIQGISVLPLGISFYTFQTLSYTIDVYRREVKTEHNIIDFGAYVVMFPQLIAGPIVKYRDVSAQLHVYKHRYSLQQIEEGMTLFTFGLAKKVLLADAVGALWTDIIGIADSPSTTFVGLANASTPLVWLGVIAYSLQLYFDFSGYSMMAIGMGKMLGFDFPQNFNFPYISRSITEFWRRWHMTLSGWFREYVYIPLGGNRKGLKRQIFNLFVVELLTGIWHGADWNFICWGLYYFVLLALEKLFLLKYLEKGRIWPHIYTMFLVVVGWAMFVGNEAGVGFGLLFRKLFLPSGGASPVYFLRNYGVLLAVSILCCTPLIEKIWNALRKHTVTRVAAVLVLLVLSTAYVVGSTNSPFLYFNFKKGGIFDGKTQQKTRLPAAIPGAAGVRAVLPRTVRAGSRHTGPRLQRAGKHHPRPAAQAHRSHGRRAEQLLYRLHQVCQRSGVWPGRVDQPAGLCGDSPLPEDRERRHPAGQRTPDVPPHLQPALQRDPRPAQEHRRPGIPLPALSGQGQRDAGAGGLRDLPGERPRGRPAPP